MLVVTGAAGFIGSHLVAELRGRGHIVIGIDRRPGADHEADLLRDHTALKLLREADAVFHLAGAGGVRRSGPGAQVAWRRDNVKATEVVLATVPVTTPLVVTSSSSVYGGATSGRHSRETDTLRPRGGYARSKVQVEQLCAERLRAGGHVAVARPFTVAGERQRPDMALHRWLHAAAAGEPLTVFGPSDARSRDVTDVRQVAFALADLASREVTGTVNLGTGRSRTLEEMIAAVERAAGPVTVKIEPAAPDEADATLADTTRCHQELGFTLHTDLDDLVRRQAEAAGLLPATPTLTT